MKLIPMFSLVALMSAGTFCMTHADDTDSQEKRVEKSEVRTKTAEGETRERRVEKDEKTVKSTKHENRSGRSDRRKSPERDRASRSGSNRGPG